MKYIEYLTISQKQADEINHHLTVEPESWLDCLDKWNTISCTVTFKNGYEIDIKCCGDKYSETESNLAWTEAVLFNEKGGQVCCSEIDTRFVKEWVLQDGDDEYIVLVNVK